MKKISEFCPVRDIMSEIGSKWAVLIMITLEPGVMRFSDIWRSIPDISQKVLTSELRTLERFSLVERKVYPEAPPRVEYTLTELGHSFLKVLRPVIQWAIDNKDVCLAKVEKL